MGDKLPIEDRLYSTVKELEEKAKEKGVELVDDKKQEIKAIGSFVKNYIDLRKANTKNADKFFHAKAGCEASQYGEAGAKIAKRIGDMREDFDLIKNKYKKKKDGTRMTTEEIIKDYMKDQSANYYGREQGRKNKNGNCSFLVDKYRPNGLDKKY